MTELVGILAVSVFGAMAGSEFAVAAFLHPILGRLPDDAFRAARGAGALRLGRVMPLWYLASLALLIAAAISERSRLIAVAVGLLAAVVVVTVAVLVPINNRIAAGEGSSRLLAARWDRLHRWRVAALVVVLALLVAGESATRFC